jgi:transposase
MTIGLKLRGPTEINKFKIEILPEPINLRIVKEIADLPDAKFNQNEILCSDEDASVTESSYHQSESSDTTFGHNLSE